jgi:uncharacterized protein
MGGLVFDVSGLLKKPGSVETVEITDTLPAAEKGHEPIEVIGPVHATLRLKEASGRIIVDGILRADVVLTCGRCVEQYDHRVEQPFSEIFRRHDDFNRDDPEEAEEENLFAITEMKIDVGPMLHEALVMAVPFKPICRDECPGIEYERDEEDEDEPGFKAALKKYAAEHPDDDNK